MADDRDVGVKLGLRVTLLIAVIALISFVAACVVTTLLDGL